MSSKFLDGTYNINYTTIYDLSLSEVPQNKLMTRLDFLKTRLIYRIGSRREKEKTIRIMRATIKRKKKATIKKKKKELLNIYLGQRCSF